MNILVTGGAGYIGSTLIPLLLEQGHTVRALDNLLHGGAAMLGFWAHPAFHFVKADMRDTAALEAAVQGMDAVVHLAAIVGDPACARDKPLARAVNLDASLALLDLCRRRGIERFLFASTCSNYGKMADPTQYVDETSELRPVSLYAETKVAVEQAVLDLPADDFCPTLLRFATVYGVGARMRFDLTVNEFTMELLTRGQLQVFGEQFWRPYVHVRDAARAIALILASPAEQVRGQVFNIGATAENYTKQMLVELIQPYAPEAVVEFVHKAEDPRDYRVSFARIQQQLGFEVTRTVPDGIAEVAALVTSGVLNDFDAPHYRN